MATLKTRRETGISQSEQLDRRRWGIAILLFLATVLNYLDRQVLSMTSPVLRQEMGLTAIYYSQVVFSFLLAYTIMQSVTGRLVDRIGPKRGLTLAMLGWSVAGMFHAAARSPFQLGVFRFLLGAGEAGNWPAAVKAIHRWFPPRQRAFAVGFFNSGSAIGALLAPPVIAWLTLTYSWRVAFVATGSLGLLWILPWLIVHRGANEPGRTETTQEVRLPWIGLLRDRRVLGLMLARFCCDPVWWFYVFWLPDYLSRARGFTLAMIGYTAWVPFLSADLGNFAGGSLSGSLVKRGWDIARARKTVMAGSVLMMTSGLLVVRADAAGTAIALVSLATFAYSCWAANILTLPADLFEDNSVASVVGLSGSAAGLGGMLSTLAVGWAVDHGSYTAVFAAAALLPGAALSFILLFVKSRKILAKSGSGQAEG